MTLVLRVLLIIISVLTFAYIIVNIRKSKVKLESLIFWIIFGLMLVVLSVFPKIAMFASSLAGFYAPINFILVSIIFLLIYKVFTLTMHLSQIQQKLEDLVRYIALKEAEDNKAEKQNKDEPN
ncbi:MAG: DUF2304 domain-containing protein, partial [Spirochaetaceae bacterium]|nr:DUF2304 domain-containing protein [Spirochaetaceae bacterium]